MNTSSTFRKVCGTIAAVSVLATTGATAAMGMSSQERHAMLIRGQALNKLYGNGVTRMSPAEFRASYLRGVAMNRLYGKAAVGPTAQEIRAEKIRGQALNELYGNGQTRLSPAELRALTIRSEALNRLYGGKSTVSLPTAVSGNGFGWDEAGIGIASAFGVALIGLAGATVVRRRGKIVQPRF